MDFAIFIWAIEFILFCIYSMAVKCRNASFHKLTPAVQHHYLSKKRMQRSVFPAAQTSNKIVCRRPVNDSLQTYYLIGCLIRETRFGRFSDAYECLSSPAWVSAPVFQACPRIAAASVRASLAGDGRWQQRREQLFSKLLALLASLLRLPNCLNPSRSC